MPNASETQSNAAAVRIFTRMADFNSPGPIWRQNADRYYSDAYAHYAKASERDKKEDPRLVKLHGVFRAFDVKGSSFFSRLFVV